MNRDGKYVGDVFSSNEKIFLAKDFIVAVYEINILERERERVNNLFFYREEMIYVK